MNSQTITQDRITQLLTENRAFFAFSQEQLDEKKEPEVQYVSLGMGLICPKENAKKLADGLTQNSIEGIARDLQENGKDKIILRELINHEAFYVYDITDTKDALAHYNITDEEIWRVFNENVQNYD